MTPLPVWIAGWQIGCCGDDHVATVGEPWAEVLLLVPDTMAELLSGEPGWVAKGAGEIRFIGRVRSTRIPGPMVLDLGPCRLGLSGPQGEMRRWTQLDERLVEGVGQVHADWHTGFDPRLDADVLVEGIVSGISVAKQVLRRTEDRFAFVGHTTPEVVEEMPLSPRMAVDVLLELDVPND